jgi:hypothetical protein
MSSTELMAKAQKLRSCAQDLEQRANALRMAESLRSQAAQLIAQATQIERPCADESEETESQSVVAAPPTEPLSPALFRDPMDVAQNVNDAWLPPDQLPQ